MLKLDSHVGFLPVQPSTGHMPPETMLKSEPKVHFDPSMKPEGDPQPTGELSTTTPDSESKSLSSGESSEDEEGEKEATGKEDEGSSILPSSVLDKASTIAQHFTNGIKRGSLDPDDTRSLGCASPRLLTKTIGLSAEPINRPLGLSGVNSDPAETFGTTDLTLISQRDDVLFNADRGVQRRRDSALSRQDQLLIGKIRSYYENAENQDATFSLQRRESLTYIPTGLVRSSVSRFNSIPNDENTMVNPSSSTVISSSDIAAVNSTIPTDTAGLMVSSNHLDAEDLGFDRRGSNRSQTIQDKLAEDEEFRPSSEMIKIWQKMEQEITGSPSEDGGGDLPRKASRNASASDLGLCTTTTTQNKNCDREIEASLLSTITEKSTSSSLLKHGISVGSRTGSLKDSLKVLQEEAAVLRAAAPRVSQPKAEQPSEESNQLDDKAESKVRHLARQYSQRIKTSIPVVCQRGQVVLIDKKILPCVMEEVESSGTSCVKLNMVVKVQGQQQEVVPRLRVERFTYVLMLICATL